ncbi:MAG TPA: HAMP domain-containing sensor histidine kinase, partial [Flavobacteriales bacterium]|nr:HAMP domain-containing sensor histidine kinase [Flavobacteriales bacterium]
QRLQAKLAVLAGEVPVAVDPARRFWMVVGEAGVFLLLLLVFLLFMYRAVRRELRAAAAQRNFLLAVTHELRTPIAAVKLQLQTLARPNLAAEQTEALRVAAIEEADRLALLTDKVLLATSAEEGAVPLRKEPMDVMDALRQVIERTRATIDGSHAVELNGPEQLRTQSDPHAIRSIAENLIENAVKYAPAHTTITVEVKPGADGWRLMVMDEGPGVAAEEREVIFDRFYRSGSEETRSAKGTGLGLYIVKRLVERMGGTVEVRARRPQGAIFAASFPHR